MIPRRLFLALAALPGFGLLGRARAHSRAQRSLTRAEFAALLETVAAAWNAGDARKAADCYTDDAIYEEPPGKQLYHGRAELYEFFGGSRKPEPPMHMRWHHVVYDENQEIGCGEYTFQMNHRYHGVVMVHINGGKIARWREYQYPSELSWEQFSAATHF